MPSLSFKKEAVVHIVYGTVPLKYKIDVSEIDFGQTFRENSYEVKTLHNQSSFEGSVINQANPAEFSFNTPLLSEGRHKVVFDRLLDCATFDLYISTQSDDVWKLDKCVIQDGTFEINKSRPLRLSISGEASKLSKHSEAIPGTLQTAGTSTTTYIIPKLSTFTIGSDDISNAVTGISVEIQNDIEWNKYNTLHGATSATNAATSQYPENFTIGTRVLAGTITKYLEDDSTSVLTWSSNTSLRLRAGNGTQELDFNITNCSFTNRMSTPDVFREEYNWRMTQNPTALSSVITYTTA